VALQSAALCMIPVQVLTCITIVPMRQETDKMMKRTVTLYCVMFFLPSVEVTNIIVQQLISVSNLLSEVLRCYSRFGNLAFVAAIRPPMSHRFLSSSRTNRGNLAVQVWGLGVGHRTEILT
jgi:hypothetical protein